MALSVWDLRAGTVDTEYALLYMEEHEDGWERALSSQCRRERCPSVRRYAEMLLDHKTPSCPSRRKRVAVLRELRGARQGRHLSEAAALVLGFSGIAMVLAACGMAVAVRRYVDGGTPPPLAVTVILFAWVAASVWAQMRTAGDHKWNRFVSIMPVGPIDRMLLVLESGVMPAAGGLCVLLGVLVGARVDMISLAALARWPVLIMALPWGLALGTMLTVALAPGSISRRFVAAILLFWWLLLVLRIGVRSFGDSHFVDSLSGVLATCPGLRILGVNGLARSLTAPAGGLWAPAAVTCLHMGVVSLLSSVCAFYVISRTNLQAGPVSLPLSFSKRVGGWAHRRLPGELGGQFTLEWLRVMRSSNSLAIVYVLVPFGIALVDLRRPEGGFLAALAVAFGAMCFAVDVGAYLLDGQQGRRLYELYGVDARHYVVSFIAAFSLTASMIHAVQIAAMGLTDWRFITTMFCSYAATVVILTDLGVVLVRRSQSLSLVSKAISGVICLFVALVILGLSFYSWMVPLLIAFAYLFSKFRATGREEVRVLYWGLQC